MNINTKLIIGGSILIALTTLSCKENSATNTSENNSQSEEYTEGMTADDMPYYLSDEAQYNQYWSDFQMSLTEGWVIDWNSLFEIEGQLGEDYQYLFEDEYTKQAIAQTNYWDLPYVTYQGEKVREFSVTAMDASGAVMGTKFFIAERPNGLKIIGFEGY